ncbi:DUF11 domain-containing protein [Candidatus Saccharibacteria bacterium]|nr:DUF11 domain-containing protein [Candidatus Saccharibacteria bacterium]
MNKIYKAVLGVAVAGIVAGASIAPVAMVNAGGDSLNGRPAYTLAQIDNQVLGDSIVLNSISDGPFGDERNFVGAKQSTDNGTVWNADNINVKDGDVVTIRLFVHNNSPKGEDAIAKGVSASFSMPTAVGSSQTIVGYLNASNDTVHRYWDEVTLNSDSDFYLEYVNGSAKYTNNVGTFALTDSIITSGAALGYTSMNGEIPGCYQYSGQATIQVKVHSSINSKVAKTVRIKGTKTWSESVEAKVGDEVEYQIEYVNLLEETAKNVMIRDVLPNNVEYVAGSTYLYNASHQNGIQLTDDSVTTSGINIGNYVTGGNAYVRFTVKVVDKDLACGNNQLVNWASSTVNGKVVKDDASVMVSKTGGTCDEVPANSDPVVHGTPSTIVNTGPETIVTGAIGAGSAVTALGYFIASRKKLI